MEIYLTCLGDHCYWSGYADELVAKTDDLDDRDFSYCPDCGGNDFDEELTEADDVL